MEFLESVVHWLVGFFVPLFEITGIVVLIISIASSFVYYIKGLISHKDYNLKLRLAQELALSLQFEMAAEILKSVLVQELKELAILAAVIVLRALLAFIIHFETKHMEHDH